MAWTDTTKSGVGNSKPPLSNAWGASFGLSGLDDSKRFIMVLVQASDNFTTTDGNTNDHTLVRETGTPSPITYTKLREFTNGQGAAAAGACVSIWAADYGFSSGGQFNVGGTANIEHTWVSVPGAWAMMCRGFYLPASSSFTSLGATDLANDGVDAGAITISGLTSKEYLFVRGTAVEGSGTTYTVSTNYTQMFASLVSATTSGGSATSNIGSRGEFRIFTGTGDTTNPTTSASDQASSMVALSEVVATPQSLISRSKNAYAGHSALV